MPERLLRYMISLWAQEIRNGVEKLPAIIPIVVYNGLDKKWDIPREIINEFDIFKDDIFRYALVDIKDTNMKSYLQEEEDVLSPIVFYLEQVRYDSNELIKRLKEVEKNLIKLSFNNIERFIMWLENVIRPRLLEEQRIEFDELAKNIKQGGVNKMGEFVSIVRVGNYLCTLSDASL